jgi:hypothetical protein
MILGFFTGSSNPTMKIAPQKNTVNRIPAATKCTMALQAIGHQQTLTQISKNYQCSRTTVHAQKNRALEAVTSAFADSADKVLFTVSVTQAMIDKMVVGLFCICESGYRGIKFFLKSIFDHPIAVGSVFNTLDAAADKAACINDTYELSSIKSSAADEIFHRNQPILSVVDIASRFCALLVKANERDHETWGIHLLDLQARGYAPATSIVDEAKGLIKGHAEILPETALRHDHFHFIRDLKDCGRYLRNQVASTTTAALKLFYRAEKAQGEKKKVLSETASVALAQVNALEGTTRTFQLLAQWLQFDVLQLAGYAPAVRAALYDFIVSEMMILADRHPHRIEAIVTSLRHRRNALLNVADALNVQFAQLAERYKISINTIWDICYTTRYGIDSCTYHDKSSALATIFGEKYEEIEDAVLTILAKTHRCSSMVENLHSRLRPHLDERKFISQKILGLQQFYLNHKPFMRSQHEHLVNKTPAEALTGKPHLPWLEMLGFPAVKEYVV